MLIIHPVGKGEIQNSTGNVNNRKIKAALKEMKLRKKVTIRFPWAPQHRLVVVSPSHRNQCVAIFTALATRLRKN